MPLGRTSTVFSAPCHDALPAVGAGLRGTAPGDAPDAYMGLLATEGELRLYGYATNTRRCSAALFAGALCALCASPLLLPPACSKR